MSEPGTDQRCPVCGNPDLRDKWDRSAYCSDCDARRDCGSGAFEADDSEKHEQATLQAACTATDGGTNRSVGTDSDQR